MTDRASHNDDILVVPLVARVDADVKLLVLVVVLRVELLFPVVLSSNVAHVALPVPRLAVDVEVLVPVAVLRVKAADPRRDA